MHCAICDQDERVFSAIAICQRCGAGVCRAHLHIFSHPGAPAGMLGPKAPRRECVCHWCLAVGQAPEQRATSAPSDALPDAAALVQTVEALLNNQGPMSAARPRANWQRLWHRFARRFLPGLVARSAREPQPLDAPSGRRSG